MRDRRRRQAGFTPPPVSPSRSSPQVRQPQDGSEVPSPFSHSGGKPAGAADSGLAAGSCGTAARYSNHHHCTCWTAGRDFGRRGPCQARARTCGEPRGTQGYQPTTHQAPAPLRRRSAPERAPNALSFPSSQLSRHIGGSSFGSGCGAGAPVPADDEPPVLLGKLVRRSVLCR